MDSLLLNIKSNWKIIQLEELIKINDPSQDLSRTAVFEREVQAAQHVDWKEIQLSLLDLKKEDGTPLSTSFQAKVSPDTAKILEQVQSDMMHQLSLKRLKVNYMVLLLQRNYLDQLISRQKNLVRKKKRLQDRSYDRRKRNRYARYGSAASRDDVDRSPMRRTGANKKFACRLENTTIEKSILNTIHPKEL